MMDRESLRALIGAILYAAGRSLTPGAALETADEFFAEPQGEEPKTVPLETVAALLRGHRGGYRITNVLHAAGVTHIAQLTKMTEEELLCIRSFGRGSLRIVRELLEELDLAPASPAP